MSRRTFAVLVPAWLIRVLAAMLGLTLLMASGGQVSAVSPDDDEDYPPDAIVNLLDPFGCDPAAISGEIGVVEAGSTVTVQVILTDETTGILRQAAPTGDVLGETSETAPADGEVAYTIPIETGRYGSVVVFATGTDTAGDPFTLQTPAEIVPCPPGELPRTGNSDLTRWLQIAGIALVAGAILAAAARRRHVRTHST